MKKHLILSGAILLLAGVAGAGETVTQSEQNIKEKTTHSTTVQENAAQPPERTYKSTTVEKHQQTTRDNADGLTTTQEKMEVKKERSINNNETGNENPVGSTQEYQHHSETHEHQRKIIER